MAKSLLLFLIGTSLLSTALSFCCSNTGWFSCCGRGPCNIFCCNCDGGSCQSNCGFDFGLIREVGNQINSRISAVASFVGKRNAEDNELLERTKRALKQGGGDPTLSKFHFLDVNGDGVIDLAETEAYTLLVELENEIYQINSTAPARRKRSTSMIEQDFNAMDVNGDGKIDQEEFDRSLKK